MSADVMIVRTTVDVATYYHDGSGSCPGRAGASASHIVSHIAAATIRGKETA